MEFCQLQLTCADKTEASKIAEVLLEKRLIVCSKQFTVASEFWWNESIERADEILLIMESREDLFAEIEVEISKIHSYETFVLQSFQVKRASEKAKDWLEENLKK